MSGGVGQMNWWRASVVTVIILLSLTSCWTARAAALRITGQVLGRAGKEYVKSAKGTAVTNAVTGGIWRSMGIGSAMQQMRDEDQEEISLSTQLGIVTLTVSDIGGGVLLPVAQAVVEEMITDPLLKISKEAYQLDPPAELANFLTDADVRASTKGRQAVVDVLKKKKKAIKATMGNNLDDVLHRTGRNSKLLKKITKVKKLFKVAKFAKALGPVFDVISIGMNTYSLATTAIDCHKGPDCNVGGLVASSLGIVSGVLGIVSVAVPFLAPLAMVFGIAATLVEFFWTPAEPPLPNLHLRERLYDLNAAKMRNLDVFSRMQLQAVNKFLQEGGESVYRYIYVVNQGHLPNWMEENISKPEEMLSGPLMFGLNEESDYDDKGIKKEQIEVKGQCTDMTEAFNERSGDTIGSTETRCDYFQEGSDDLIVNSKFEAVGSNLYVGPDFYGISQSPEHERSGGRSMYGATDGSEYKGVMVMVPTDRVTYRELRGEEGKETYTTPVRTRGLHIDTELRLRERVRFTPETHYDDIVAIGDMLNLGYKVEDGGHMVIVNTGKTGRDVLVIDGWVKKLEARLGSNHNTLTFRTISISKQKERRESEKNSEKQNEIKGIKFNPGSSQVIMLGYDPVTGGNVEHDLGHVRGVGFLGASPFDDEVTLFALQKDELYRNYHFTVFKFMGTATYIFDANNYKSKEFAESEVVHFKVLDASKPVSENPDTPAECVDDEAPLLKIINMHNSAQAKDVQYKGNKVYIYSTQYHWVDSKRERKPYATITFITACPAKVSLMNKDGRNLFEKKWMNKLDIMFYEGTRYDHDFLYTPNRRYTTSADDIMYLSCPRNDVTDDKAVINVETLIVDDAFFDDCLVGTNDDETRDGEDITVTWKGNTMHWKFPAKTGERGSRTIVDQTFTGVQRIMNKFTKEIVTLDRSNFNLYAAFLAVSGENIVKDSNLGQPVKDNLSMCIFRTTNLTNMKKRKAMKRNATKRAPAEPEAEEEPEPEYDEDELKDVCWNENEIPT